MKEIQSIIAAYQQIDFSQHKAALATVIHIQGSSYRRTGARMLVCDDGNYSGGISGGCLEGDALRRAQKAISQNKPSVVTYDTSQEDEHGIGIGLGCNGIIDVLFTPLNARDKNNPVHILSSCVGARKPLAYITITSSDKKPEMAGNIFAYENDELFIAGFPFASAGNVVTTEIKRCLQNQSSASFIFETETDGTVKIFTEIILPSLHLVIYGSNYDIYPLMEMADILGWQITVVANLHKIRRTEISSHVQLVSNRLDMIPQTDDFTATVLMTHDYKTDYHNLQLLLGSSVKYIGMLGPRKRFEKMVSALSAAGKDLNEYELQKIFSPAGLDIGARTPEEIALSICSEIRSVFAERPGLNLRLRKGSIYGNDFAEG